MTPSPATFCPSDYRQQIDRGFRSLRFSQPLERKYCATRSEQFSGHFRWTLFLVVAAYALLLATGYIEDSPAAETISIVAATVVVIVLLMFLATFSDAGRRQLPIIGALAGIGIGAGAIAAGAPGVADSPGTSSAISVVATMFVYFMLGLRFWPAVFIAGATFAGSVLFMVAGPGGGEHIWPALLLATANLIAATGLYNLEFGSRSDFLHRQELRFLASLDPLTGLANRAAFYEHLRMVWAHCLREKLPLAIALIDVDHFKAYNDSFGHQQGDQCLTKLAHIIGELGKRPLDIAARHSGGAFTVLLPGCNENHAEYLLEDLRREVADLKIEHGGSSSSASVSVSVGIAAVAPHATGRDEQGLIQLADTALFAAKAAGRNQVITAGDEFEASRTGSFPNDAFVRRAEKSL